MNESAYSVVTTAHFDRLLKKLAPKHPELVERLEEAIGILSRTRRTRATNIRSRSCVGLRLGKGSTGFGRGGFGFATTLRGARWCCFIVGCGGKIPTDLAPGSQPRDRGSRPQFPHLAGISTAPRASLPRRLAARIMTSHV